MGTDAARMSARSPFIGAMISISSHRPCNTSANCVVDQRPQLLFRHFLEGLLALVELLFAAAAFSQPAVNLFEAFFASRILPILQALFFAIQASFLAGHR